MWARPGSHYECMVCKEPVSIVSTPLFFLRLRRKDGQPCKLLKSPRLLTSFRLPSQIPAPQQTMAEAAFNKFDKNGDGTIDSGEIKAALEELGLTPSPQFLQVVMKRCDDGDGKLTFDEFKDKVVPAFEEIKGLKQMFDEYDEDANGEMTLDEFIKTAPKFYKNLSEDDLKGMFNYADTSGDKQISSDEFLMIMFKETSK